MERRDFLKTMAAVGLGAAAPAALADYGMLVRTPGIIRVVGTHYIGPGVTVTLEDGHYVVTQDILIDGGTLNIKRSARVEYENGARISLINMGSMSQELWEGDFETRMNLGRGTSKTYTFLPPYRK